MDSDWVPDVPLWKGFAILGAILISEIRALGRWAHTASVNSEGVRDLGLLAVCHTDKGYGIGQIGRGIAVALLDRCMPGGLYQIRSLIR